VNPLKGVALKVAATLVFTIMGVFVKLVAETIPTGQIVFCRSFFGAFPILLLLAHRRELPGALATRHPFAHLTRVSIGISSMFLGFAALALIPLPDATAIGYASPIFAVVFAALLLKEVVRIYRWSAVVVGLVGVLVILSPHLTAPRGVTGDDLSTTGALLALSGAICGALAMVTVRRLTRTEQTGTIVFYFSAGGAAIALLSIPFGWVVPSPRDMAILVTIGLLGGIAQILVTHSYRFADTSVIAPFEYTSLVWSILLAWWIFGDVPGPAMLAGSVIVIAAGLFVIWREHRLGLERKAERKAGKPGV